MPFAPPKNGAPYRLNLGLRAPEEHGWLDPDADDDATVADQLRQRARHLAERREAVLQVADEPLARAAADELLQQLLHELPRRQPDRYHVDTAAGTVTNRLLGETLSTSGSDPLEVVARLVQEDVCILAPPATDGAAYRLVAGAVCFPAHWSVLEKLGKELPDIHDPVPRWRTDAAQLAHNFMSRLTVTRPLIRWNWTLMPTPELHLSNFSTPPPSPEPDDGTNVAPLWLRLERQHFHRLPTTGCVVFSIRTYQQPLEQAVKDRPVMAQALAGALRALPHEHLEYKVNLQRRMPALLELLDLAAQQDARAVAPLSA